MQSFDLGQNVRFTIELCAEDRKRLDALLVALTARAAGGPKETAPETIPEEVPEVAEHVREVTKSTAEEPKKIELFDIQRKVVELAAAGKKAAVRELITSYAERVSTIPEDKRAEVYQKLIALED